MSTSEKDTLRAIKTLREHANKMVSAGRPWTKRHADNWLRYYWPSSYGDIEWCFGVIQEAHGIPKAPPTNGVAKEVWQQLSKGAST